MAYHDPMRIALSGDKAQAQKHVRTARVAALGLMQMNAESGLTVGRRQLKLADGTQINVVQAGHDVSATIEAGAEKLVVEVISIFTSAEDGLHIFDMSRKEESDHITGVGNFVLSCVNVRGTVVWMTGRPGAPTGEVFRLLRADLTTFDAFHVGYVVQTYEDDVTFVDGFALDFVALLPDANRRFGLLSFDKSSELSGALVEGIGGVLLIDMETLEAVRPAYRNTYEPSLAWSANGETFYIGSTHNADPGQISGYGSVPAWLAATSESTNDYINVYNIDGDLIQSMHVAVWGSDPGVFPDAGFHRTIRGLHVTPTGDRLFAAVEGFNFGGVFVANGGNRELRSYTIADDGTISHQTTLNLNGVLGSSLTTVSPEIISSRDGSRLWMLLSGDGPTEGRVLEFDISDGGISLLRDISRQMFYGVAWQYINRVFKLGPDSRIGQRPDNRLYLLSRYPDQYTLYALRDIEEGMDAGAEDPDVPQPYSLDLSEYDIDNNFALAIRSVRIYTRNSQ